jgi:membrane-associated protease RseP (regulator of RpoE activity)
VETVLLYALGVVILIVGLALSIGLHEIGHLVPAKKFGVKVGQYMIGFGPTLWSRKFGETEYGVKAIPLGGYISMAGMYPPEKQGGRPRDSSTGFVNSLVQDARDTTAQAVGEGDENRVFYKLSPWKRIIIMLGGPSMNLLLAIVFYAILLVGIGLPQSTSTLETVNACVVATGQTQCGTDDPASPAAAAGLLPGDQILSVDGTEVTNGAETSAIIRQAPGRQLDVVVLRDGEKLTLAVTPVLTEREVLDAAGAPVVDADGNPVTEKVGIVGVAFTTATVPQPITAVGPAVGDNIVGVTKIVVTLPQRLVQVAQAAFGGEERDPNGPVGVIGVGRIAGEVTSLETAPVLTRASLLLSILASLNVALFVFNLIPLLPLDGGHVAGAIWESIRRRFAKWFKRPDPGPVDIARLIPLTMVIVVILGASSLLLAYADIVNPISIL